MDINLSNKIQDVCNTLNKHSFQYLIVGGAAVALHGFFRRSMTSYGTPAEKLDLDFWYNPTYPNYFNLLDAFQELGQDVKRYKEEQAPNPKKSFFNMEFEDFTLDFLPELIGLAKFNKSYSVRQTVTINFIDVHFINLTDLITNKEVTGRPKDLIDIRELKIKNGYEDNEMGYVTNF